MAAVGLSFRWHSRCLYTVMTYNKTVEMNKEWLPTGAPTFSLSSIFARLIGAVKI